MGETLNSGTLYIDGMEFCSVKDGLTITAENCTEEVFVEDTIFPISLNETMEFSGTLNVDPGEFICALIKAEVLRDITNIINNCPNKKVVHHYLHARKFRTRKKNYNRMIKLAEKEKRQ